MRGRSNLKEGLKLGWKPTPGIYQNVLPAGPIHISMYIDGREPQPHKVMPGEDVELYEREIRELSTSGILIYGYLAPIIHFDQDPDTKEWVNKERRATEDPENANVISDEYVHIKVQNFETAQDFAEHLQSVNSYITLHRFRQACADLDTPQSWVHAIDDRREELDEEGNEQRYGGEISARRKSMLTPKIGK